MTDVVAIRIITINRDGTEETMESDVSEMGYHIGETFIHLSVVRSRSTTQQEIEAAGELARPGETRRACLERLLAALPEVQRDVDRGGWRPVTRTSPAVDVTVLLAYREDGELAPVAGERKQPLANGDQRWRHAGVDYEAVEPEWWMPLPSPPSAKDDG